MAELHKMLQYFTRLWNERVNAPPRSDLISMLAHGPATRNMSPMEYMGNLVLLIVGGNDTTRNSMTGGLLALHNNPQEMAKLRADPALIESLVPEIIRWQTPLAYMRRTALVDAELAGKQIKQGRQAGHVVLCRGTAMAPPSRTRIGSSSTANARASIYPSASAFTVASATAWQSYSSRYSGKRCCAASTEIEVVGEPTRVRSSFVRGFSKLPVRIPG